MSLNRYINKIVGAWILTKLRIASALGIATPTLEETIMGRKSIFVSIVTLRYGAHSYFNLKPIQTITKEVYYTLAER